MAEKPEDLLQRLERLGQDGVGNYGMPICAEAAAELRRLHAENALLHERHHFDNGVLKELLDAMISFTNSAYIKKQHPKRYAAAMAAIAKAEGGKA
jgi:hypothetical protein